MKLGPEHKSDLPFRIGFLEAVDARIASLPADSFDLESALHRTATIACLSGHDITTKNLTNIANTLFDSPLAARVTTELTTVLTAYTAPDDTPANKR